MVSFKAICLLSVIISCTVSTTANSTKITKKEEDSPISVKSRFFDLGGLFSQLFPGPQNHQGGHGGFGGNPNGMNFPQNSQFFPGGSQSQNPRMPLGQDNTWPAIDDARQYPNQRPFGGSQQNQYPNQGNVGGSLPTQYPNNGVGGSLPPQYPDNGNDGGSQLNQYPNNGNLGGSQPIQYPNNGNIGGSQPTQYPNNGKVGGSLPTQYPNNGVGGSQQNQYPNQGNVGGSLPTQYPNNGVGGSLPPQYPNNGVGGSLPPQYPDNGDVGGSQPIQYPNNGNVGGSMPTQYPNNGMGGSQYPNQGNFGNSQYPDQETFTNQGNQNNFSPGFGQAGDGTIDDITPPQQSWNPDDHVLNTQIQNPGQGQQQFDNSPDDGTTAILGRPVQIPSTSVPGDQIVFPSSTENPFQRQCVQDCQSTSEYSPVCGTNNVTYFNPGKFVCARNCGVNVFVSSRGRCPNDTPWLSNVSYQ